MPARNRLNLNLRAWREQFAAEPAALGAGADPIVQSSAQAAAAALVAAYPTGETGNLRAGVRVRELDTPTAAQSAALVSSTAPHAHLYEYGTIYARARPTFYPITVRYGVVAARELESMVQSRGYRVTGTATVD